MPSACAGRSLPSYVELAREAIDANLDDLSPLAKRASSDDDGAFVEDFCNWQRLPAIERFARESGAAAIAARLMGASTVRLYHDHVLVKEPGTRQRTPWHQDQPYYNIDGRQNASMWFPVDPVSYESTLQFVAGSHRGEWYMPRSFLDDQAKWFPDGTLAELPDVDGRPDEFRDHRLGARAGRCHLLPHAHAARRGRRARHDTPARAVAALPRRRHRPRPATMDDIATVPRPRRRAAGRRADGPPLFPVLWAAA